MACPSAVAIIETPESFIVEGRPDFAGQLAYAGMWQLFGGHAKPDEIPSETITRELSEEVGLHLDVQPMLVWNGNANSQNRAGQSVERYVSLFYVAIASAAELTLYVPGEIVEIPNTVTNIEERQDRLTLFAYTALRAAAMARLLGSASAIS